MRRSVPRIDAALPYLPESLLVGFYFTLLICLSAYGAHRCYLLYLYTRYRPRRPLAADAPAVLPFVTVQLPVYNEPWVVARLIDAAARLDYPAASLEIQVLDDSTDDTGRIAAQAVSRWRSRGVAIHHLRRTERTGYKAGALAAGLRAARGDAVAIFDADFLPPRDFLQRTIPLLCAPGVGMVQARWGHVNRDFSWLTRVQALLLDAHFILEHGARHRGGCFFNFNGTAGVWRRQAIEDAGGWRPDTLTEDLDLSYRAQLAGWRFTFLPELVAPAELPVHMAAFKQQQRRWTTGSIQTCLKVLPSVLRSEVRARIKLEACFHLTANFNYPLLLLASILLPPALLVRTSDAALGLPAPDVLLLCAAALSLLNYWAVSQRAVRRDWLRPLACAPVAIAVAVGLSLNNTLAVLAALRKTRLGFWRTPKYGVVDGQAAPPTAARSVQTEPALDAAPQAGAEAAGDSAPSPPVRSRRSRAFQPLAECALGLYFTAAAVAAAAAGAWAFVPFIACLQAGFLYVGLTSLLPAPHPRPAPVESAPQAAPAGAARCQEGREAPA